MKKIAMIGAGSMAEALISGMVKKQFMRGEQIWVTNRSNREKLSLLHQQYGINPTYDFEEMLQDADVILLAMKPKDVALAVKQIKPYLNHETFLVSMLAGVSIKSIEMLTERSVPIVRAMPNTSAAIGQSATALAANSIATEEQIHLIKTMFDTVGLTVYVEEKQLDAVTGLSGSGPAYIYYLIEAMEKSAVEIGLNGELAQKLIVQTLIGAAGMVSRTTKPPKQLRKEVTSPGGTTEAGLKILKEHQVQEAFIQCIKEATSQSKRLGLTLAEELEKEQRT
ncbi:pyrroline-5-carboxylate reductase [Robertmurraya sp. DFI.2.37]|uniref:pyrroline-5-carboxylate reductase n=1 Tax=Robertmurraya sp. DFI.2.37 TaxID=3031819 RepID=UPI0012441905|nr:pyrroline-5-carboxylate reductase [Robertmurraya sp. DFI.2.37]MDF1507528.1 pyrroline-5-carboxylate reductase [Robertmurraya sp. DFI.2.37]